MDDLFLIGSFSGITNVSKRMLRHYDQMELLSPYMCDEQTGYRYYSREQVQKVQLIQRLQQHGLSLKIIRSILEREVCFDAFLDILKNQEAILCNSMDESLSQLILIRESLSQLSCVTPLEPDVFFSTSCGGIVIGADKLREIRGQVKEELIDVENVSQHMRHEATKVLLEVKRTERGTGQIIDI